MYAIFSHRSDGDITSSQCKDCGPDSEKNDPRHQHV